MSQNNNFVYHV